MEWPTELRDDDEWEEFVRKPDAIYFSGGVVFIDGVPAGECGEVEIILNNIEQVAASEEVENEEVLELLRGVARGEVSVSVISDERPRGQGSTALFDVGGWRLKVGFDLSDGYEFNAFHWIEWSVAPDGRRGGFINPPELFCGEPGDTYDRVAEAFERFGDSV